MQMHDALLGGHEQQRLFTVSPKNDQELKS